MSYVVNISVKIASRKSTSQNTIYIDSTILGANRISIFGTPKLYCTSSTTSACVDLLAWHVPYMCTLV